MLSSANKAKKYLLEQNEHGAFFACFDEVENGQKRWGIREVLGLCGGLVTHTSQMITRKLRPSGKLLGVHWSWSLKSLKCWKLILKSRCTLFVLYTFSVEDTRFGGMDKGEWIRGKGGRRSHFGVYHLVMLQSWLQKWPLLCTLGNYAGHSLGSSAT